jgi:hypothetical protein
MYYYIISGDIRGFNKNDNFQKLSLFFPPSLSPPLFPSLPLSPPSLSLSLSLPLSSPLFPSLSLSLPLSPSLFSLSLFIFFFSLSLPPSVSLDYFSEKYLMMIRLKNAE